jgi:hypothetical protein
MLDVHPYHESAHSWRDFFARIASSASPHRSPSIRVSKAGTRDRGKGAPNGNCRNCQKYGGFPALASASPERMAKNAAMHGCSTSLNFIGPLTRAIN